MPHLSPPPEPPPQRPSAPSRFECALESSGRAATWIRARGELDHGTAPRLEQALHVAFSSGRVPIVDLRQLTFIDSSGLHLIIDADARARRSHRRLMFVRGPEPIDRLFDLTGLSDRLEITDLKPVLVPAPQLNASGPSETA